MQTDHLRTYRVFFKMNQLNVHILHFKAVVRAIDTVQDVAMKLANVEVNRFMVSGASKVCIVFILNKSEHMALHNGNLLAG